MNYKDLRFAAVRYPEILAEAAQARLAAGARPARTQRRPFPSLVLLARSVRNAVTALATVAIKIDAN